MYGSVEDADAYHLARRSVVWAAATAAEKAAAIVLGSDYVDGVYPLTLFSGVPTGGADQERNWPMTGAVDIWGFALDSATVPVRVEHAAYAAAVQELVLPGSLKFVYNASKQIKRKKAGPVEVEYFVSASFAESMPQLSEVQRLMGPLGCRRLLPAVFVV